MFSNIINTDNVSCFLSGGEGAIVKETMSLKKNIEKRFDILNLLISKKSEELRLAPPGKIRITHNKGCVQYYYNWPEEKQNSYIPKDQMEKIKALAQKQYDQSILDSAVKERELLKKYLHKLPALPFEEIYGNMPEARQKLVVPVIETDEVFVQRWKEQPYPNISTRKEHPVILNDQGMKLDSKAELAIANQFEKRGIPYLTQFPVYLQGYGWVYADFKLLNVRLREEYYWEHLGMLDSPAYRKNCLPKLNRYILNGYLPGSNLILSWESEEARLDMRVIDMLIDSYLL